MVGFLAGAAALTSIAGGIKGLFSSNKAPKVDIADNIHDQARGARQAADKFGFNPLTMLGASGAVAGVAQGGGGSTPPLASIDAITSGLQGLDDIMSGDAARRRQANELELDMARLKLDQARSGVLMAKPTATIASGVGAGPSPLGRQAVTAVQTNTQPATPAGFGPKPAWATGRQLDVAPVTNSPGVFELQNPWTNDKPITIPGEGEPWGIDELGTAVAVGVPQVLRNVIRDERETLQSEEPEETRARRRSQASRVIRGETFIPQPGFLGAFQAARKLWN